MSDAVYDMDLNEAAAQIATPADKLRVLAMRGKFVEVLYVARGIYRVNRKAFERWKESRTSSAMQAKADLVMVMHKERP